MRPTAFDNPGRFWRGNIHTHCDASDGALDVAEVCHRYKAQGYDFLALTDHFVGLFDYPITDTRPFRDDSFTTLIGAELHSGAMENGDLWHILAVGLPFDFTPSNSPHFMPVEDQESAPEIARRARDAGAFVAIVHPEWSGLTEAEMISIDAAHAVEVYNHGSQVETDRGRGLHSADLLARTGKKVSFIATDDAHFRSGDGDAFGGWVMVKATENTPEALLEALKQGAMYSTMGPEIHDIEIDDRYVRVRCSAVSAIVLQGQGVGTEEALGESLTQARLPLSRVSGSPWFRITLIDAAGRRAWSNPIWRA